MYFDRFDIYKAYHLWFTDFYGGALDPNYIRRCRMESKFHFSPSLCHSYENLTENGKSIYDQLEKEQYISRSY
tara:strand:- start:238 stop:456 length:219 start_codon:yes stop_codon:yes gene_type:complete